MKNLILVLCMLFVGLTIFAQAPYTKYQAMELSFAIDETSETSPINPFADYRLQVVFTHGKTSYSVPGYYAGDGNAAQTSASSGGLWLVRFVPNEVGEWTYKVSFRTGKDIAVQEDAYVGEAVNPHDGTSGTFSVNDTDQGATHFAKSGRLGHRGDRYFTTEDGMPFLKMGANSPENFLAYKDIDGTYGYHPDFQFIKTWSDHIPDWNEGDPSWQKGKGKGIIGALNYLAKQGMNSVYALTMNIDGDGKDVWPYLSHERKDFKRFDVSKLAQWDIIFGHAENLGIVMHLITQEKENELLLDDGDTGIERKLYYRELIARFGYHQNIVWNMGEENGQAPWWMQGQNDQQRFSMIRYLKDHDPFKNPLVIHTLPEPEMRVDILDALIGYQKLDGLSMQISNPKNVYEDIFTWVEKSQNSSRPWIVSMDEIGPWHTGARNDMEDPAHDTLRQKVLWPALMAGASGIEWYFGYRTDPNDLTCQNWTNRKNLWKQTKYAKDFFSQFPLSDLQPIKASNTNKGVYTMAKERSLVLVYFESTKEIEIHFDFEEGAEYNIEWYDPRKGSVLTNGSKSKFVPDQDINVGSPPSNYGEDWALILRKM